MADSTDAKIESIARGQHGLVTRAQLRAAGVHDSLIYRRLKTGRFQRIHWGIYRVGPVEAPRAQLMAAILACGPGAVISHTSAAVLWSLLPAITLAGSIHVSIPGRDVRRRDRLQTHRVNQIPKAEMTRVDGIPVTTPARTIVDLAGRSDRRQLERVVSRAERQNLADRSAVAIIATRNTRRPGVSTLMALLDAGQEISFTRSEAEDRFLAVIRGSGLPRPEVNVVVAGIEVDFLWKRERLVVEVDGYQYHNSRSSYENDRRRDGLLARSGYQVIRVTWKQITQRRDATLVLVAQALARTGAARP